MAKKCGFPRFNSEESVRYPGCTQPVVISRVHPLRPFVRVVATGQTLISGACGLSWSLAVLQAGISRFPGSVCPVSGEGRVYRVIYGPVCVVLSIWRSEHVTAWAEAGAQSSSAASAGRGTHACRRRTHSGFPPAGNGNRTLWGGRHWLSMVSSGLPQISFQQRQMTRFWPVPFWQGFAPARCLVPWASAHVFCCLF